MAACSSARIPVPLSARETCERTSCFPLEKLIFPLEYHRDAAAPPSLSLAMLMAPTSSECAAIMILNADIIYSFPPSILSGMIFN